MSDTGSESKIHIDTDWKEEAAQEKQRLTDEENKAKHDAPKPGDANFMEVVNLLAMQAAIALGGYQGPGGERLPPNPAAAQHHIALLEALQVKTAGNLTEDEQKGLDAVLHELRLAYVQSTTGQAPPVPDAKA